MTLKLFKLFIVGLIPFSIFVLTNIGNAMASWTKITDDALLKEADIVVYARYLGESEIRIKDKEFQVNLGVLGVSQILKGRLSSKLLFIKRYDPGQPISSDMILFKQGQSGLWVLNEQANSTGIYEITYPGQYKNVPENSDLVKQWQIKLK